MIAEKSQLDLLKAAKKRSAIIDRQLKSEGKTEQKYIKLLLLGTELIFYKLLPELKLLNLFKLLYRCVNPTGFIQIVYVYYYIC